MQKKGKDPAFLMYSSDFLTGTHFLSDDQKGKFITLLCFQHQKGRLSEKHMQSICKAYDNDIYEMFTKDDDGLFYNERLEDEANKRKKHSQKQKENIMKRWNKDTNVLPDKQNDNTKVIPNVIPNDISNKQTGITTVIPLEDENENENENRDINRNRNETEIEIYPTFEDFWDLYDKKSGSRRKTEAKFKGLPHKIKLEIIDHLDLYIPSTPDKQFRKDPITYLNNEGWLQEIINQNKNESRNKNNTDYSELKALVQSANF